MAGVPPMRLRLYLRELGRSLPGVPGFDGIDGVSERLAQDALADGPEHGPEHSSLKVLALAYDDGVNGRRPVGLPEDGDVAFSSSVSPGVDRDLLVKPGTASDRDDSVRPQVEASQQLRVHGNDDGGQRH
jgi:hypothetical protein